MLLVLPHRGHRMGVQRCMKLVNYHGSHSMGLTYKGTLGTVGYQPEHKPLVHSHPSDRESTRIVRLKSKKR